MAETPDRFCRNCGHELSPEDQFCPNCGTPVHRAAHVPTPEADVPVPPPPGQQAGQATRRRALTPVMMLGIGVVLVLLLGVGSVAALTLLRGGTESPEAAGDQGEAPAEVTETPRPNESVEKPTPPKTAKEGNDAENAEKEPTPEEASGPAPGYNLVQSPDGGLSVEVPQSWGVETGANSEKQGGPGSWSYFAGEYLTSSITTAPNLDAWYSGGTSGAYMVASKGLTQYTDYELTHSLFYANKNNICTTGPYEDYNRESYSGKMQTWYDCGVDGATTYTVAARPEGGGCVVVFDARISDEADRKAIEHLINTFEVDCGRVTSEALATPSEPPSPTTYATPSATPSPSPNPSPNRDYNAPEPSAGVPPPPPDGDYDCADLTYAQAQQVLASDPTDPYDLDGDDNGIACE